MNSMRIGIVQMGSGDNKEENINKALEFVQKAINEGAELIVLPELFNYLPSKMTKKGHFENAEDANGPSIKALEKIAKSYNVVIIAGSLTELDGENLYNTSFVISNRGILGKYRKVHLFKFGNIDETLVFKAGNKAEVVDINGAKIGLTICFDLRFPELFRTEALMGANLIVNVAAFLEKTGKMHWMPLLRVRSIENQVYLVAANQATIKESTCKYYGHSCIIDPWGKIVTKAKGEECVIVGDITLQRVEQIRRKMPLLEMRRLDVYDIMKN
ncbi:MAG: carbon-nitrogen hydrolase family protein [Candidatus Methanomethyliaceae archaeon]